MADNLIVPDTSQSQPILDVHLNAWILGGPTPVSAKSTAVAGCVRWIKPLGQPEGPMPGGQTKDAFVIKCYRNDGVTAFKGEPQQPLRADQDVLVWDGPHDDSFFRVSYLTESRQTRGWDPEDPGAWNIDLNVLEVRFANGVRWKNTIFSGRGSKVVPRGYEFYFPGAATLLPDINVIHTPYSVSKLRPEP